MIALAADLIRKRIESGDSLRQDSFGESEDAQRSQADEVVESIVLKCQREAEEKKIPYMANLLANVAFDDEISWAMAHQIIRCVEQLTYRQLCLLRIGALRESLELRTTDYRHQGHFEKVQYQILYECLDLSNRGLVNNGGSAVLGVTDIIPSQMGLQGIGADIYNLLELKRIPMEDITDLVAVLRIAT